MTFFWFKFGFGKCFRASSRSNHQAGCCWLSYKIHFSSHITTPSRNGSLLLHRVRADDTSKRQFFWFAAKSWGTELLSFFIFPICFKCWMTTEWLMLNSSATSYAVVRGSVSMTLSVGHCQLPMASHCIPHLQGFHLLCKTSWTHRCTVQSLAVPGPNALLMLQVVSTALQPILNANKKIAQVCFMSNIISLV